MKKLFLALLLMVPLDGQLPPKICPCGPGCDCDAARYLLPDGQHTHGPMGMYCPKPKP